MTSLFVLEVPENLPVIDVGRRAPGVRLQYVGPYAQLVAEGEIVIDRRATGTRHAVWYSSVAGTRDARIVQHDRDCLRLVPA